MGLSLSSSTTVRNTSILIRVQGPDLLQKCTDWQGPVEGLIATLVKAMQEKFDKRR